MRTSLADLNQALNRPRTRQDNVGNPPPDLPAITPDQFTLDVRETIVSGMANALVDVVRFRGLSVFAGAGVGGSRTKIGASAHRAFAYQAIAGARYPLLRTIELRLEYRYFGTGRIDAGRQSERQFGGNTFFYTVSRPMRCVCAIPPCPCPTGTRSGRIGDGRSIHGR